MKKIEIEFINNIENVIDEYIKKTGTTKIWLAEHIGMSKQNFYNLLKSPNPSIQNLLKISILCDCQVKDLYKYRIKK